MLARGINIPGSSLHTDWSRFPCGMSSEFKSFPDHVYCKNESDVCL